VRNSNIKPIRLFLNPYCKYGSGRSRWEKVKAEIQFRIGSIEIEEILSPEEIVSQVSRAVENGENRFVAAGGDGTVNLLLNAVMELSEGPELTIGAVGIGSSNDFHKPFRREAFINGIPVRIDFRNAFPCDVIRIDYRDIQGDWKMRFCLINASIGLTAEANALFNSRLRVIKMLQGISVDAAITAAALKVIFTYPNIPCQLTVDGEEEQTFPVTNLGIVKNPHFAGSLCYDTPIEPDDGKLGIHLSMGLSRCERIGLLAALYQHGFQGQPKTKSWMATRLSVKGDRVFALEMDGEVIRTNRADLRMIPKRVRCCR
jgi:diacylglycerol kinase family enzyme